jgi:hypothetical protein
MRTRQQWFWLSIVGSATVMGLAYVVCGVITDSIIAAQIRVEDKVYETQCRLYTEAIMNNNYCVTKWASSSTYCMFYTACDFL